MLEKLREIEEKYNSLEERMQTPEVYTDPAAYAKLAKEQKEIAPVVEAYRKYTKLKADAEGALELMSDPDFKEMAQEEYEAAKAEMEKTEERAAERRRNRAWFAGACLAFAKSPRRILLRLRFRADA